MSNPNHPPNFVGLWCVRGETLEYDTAASSVNLSQPEHSTITVEIRQSGRFFTWIEDADTEHPAKLGVFERIFLRGEFAGWQAYVVNTTDNNNINIINFTRICDNIVQNFEITEVESGFNPDEQDQHPRVETAFGRRLCKTRVQQ